MIGETYHHTGATSRWLLRHQQIPKAYLGVRPESRDGESELLAVDQGLQLGARKRTKGSGPKLVPCRAGFGNRSGCIDREG